MNLLDTFKQIAPESHRIAKEHGFVPAPIAVHLHGILGEISKEAVPAYFESRRSPNIPDDFTDEWFKQNVKDTLEDEIADITLRTLTLCHEVGAFDLCILKCEAHTINFDEIYCVSSQLLLLSKHVSDSLVSYKNNSVFSNKLIAILKGVITISERIGFDLEKHMRAKMKYNTGRPYMHKK
jgi:hypothetical protein